MLLEHMVVVNAEQCGPEWGHIGYWWLEQRRDLAIAEPPFQWLAQHARGEWDWQTVGDPDEPQEELLTLDNYHRFDRFCFRFYFALASDAVLFKLTWT